MDRIVIANKCLSLVDNSTGQRWVDAIQRQVANDFAPLWDRAAILHYIGDSQTEKPAADDGVVSLVATSSSDGTLGTHWFTSGRAVGEVGVQTCLDDDVKPPACLAHEILEMILDPPANLCYQVGRLIWAGEACDRVEDSDDTYTVDGVPVENFSTPAAFQDGASGPYDFRGKCTSNVVLPNGYQLYYDLASGQWMQTTGALARRSKQGAGPSSRRASRILRAGGDPKSLVLVAA